VKRSRSLQRGHTFPTTGVGDHQIQIIDHNLGRESGVAFIAVVVLGKPCVALGKKLHLKVGKLDPSGDDRPTLPNTEVKTPDRESVSCRRDCEINVETAT